MAKERGEGHIFEDFNFYIQRLRIYHLENN